MQDWEFCNIYIVANTVSVLHFGKDLKTYQFEAEKYDEIIEKLKQAGWELVELEEEGKGDLIQYKRPMSETGALFNSSQN